MNAILASTLLASTLIHFLWQGAAIAFIYAIVRSWPGSSRTPEFRYLLACSALTTMAIAPVITFCILRQAESIPATIPVAASIATSSATAIPAWLTPLSAAALSTWRENATNWIVLAWLIGAIALCARLIAGGIVASRVRSDQVRPAPAEWQKALDNLRAKIGISKPARLLVSALVQVPIVVGTLRAVVLVPVGALTGIDPALVEALLAHELAHIRRHDYLVNILQSVAEAILFYHPAIWWISNHIRQERELCCDDIAVAACGDTLLYARALSELESCRPAHLNPALAANGGSLADRISRLLGVAHPVVRPVPAHIVAAVFVAATLALVPRIAAQPQVIAASSLPSFEVASIKPSDPDSNLKIDFAAGGRLFVTHATLRFLIKIAYDVSDDQIIGGPAWLSSKRFDVQGKPATALAGDPEKMTKDEILLFHEPIRLRLQRLLADRFQLELRKEPRPMPIFALTVSNKGTKMKSDSDPGDPVIGGNTGHGMLKAIRVDMDMLAHFLSEGQVGRPVVNMTGLNGKFDFRLEWTPDQSQNPLSVNSAANNQQQPIDAAGTSIFTALQQQLGLKLDARTGSVDGLVVTRAELPSEN